MSQTQSHGNVSLNANELVKENRGRVQEVQEPGDWKTTHSYSPARSKAGRGLGGTSCPGKTGGCYFLVPSEPDPNASQPSAPADVSRFFLGCLFYLALE